MSEQFSTNYDSDAENDENQSTTSTPCEPILLKNFSALEKTVERQVYGLTKWVSALEDKVADLNGALQLSLEKQSECADSLKKMSESMAKMTKETERLRRKRFRLRMSNYELGAALSGKLFKSEAKRAKIEYVPKNEIHASVLPYIVSESESE